MPGLVNEVVLHTMVSLIPEIVRALIRAEEKRGRNYYHRLLFISAITAGHCHSSHLNGFIQRYCKSYTIFSSFRFKRDEHGNYWKRKFCMCIRVSLRNSFPPLLPSSSPPSFLKKRIAKRAGRRGVGDDLDIPSRAVVSWKFTLTSTKDLCAFHRVRARKRKFDRVWS